MQEPEGSTFPDLPRSEPPIASNATPQAPAPLPAPALSFKVARQKCKTCIFGPNSPIGPERLREHISATLDRNTYAICHTAQIVYNRDSEESKVACRGFYDAFGDATLLMRLAKMLGIVEEVVLPKAEWENQQTTTLPNSANE